MRALILCSALLAAACSVDVGKDHHGGGYTVEIRANGADHVFVVTGPDGRAVAARAHEGTSAMLDAHELQQALAAMPPPAPTSTHDDHGVSINGPGFSLHASGDDGDETTAATTAATTTAANSEKPASDEHDRGAVTMNIGGFGLNVNADDGGPGEADDRAQVRLTGLSAHDARKFITEADDLSPAVQAQMLTALGLSQDE
jgi:hypothetical protein